MIVEFFTHSLVAVVGVLVALAFSRRSDRLRKALDLYERYNSPEIIGARNKAWRYLNTEYKGEPIWELYSDKEHILADRYDALVQVSYFWYALFVLGKEGVINKRLAKELFKEQFVAWRRVLRPLYAATVAAVEKQVGSRDWQEFRYMEDPAMSWLAEGEKNS